MNTSAYADNRNIPQHGPNWAFSIITLMHDNPLLPFLINRYKVLKAAGLKSGQTVLEVGCGPGFFTIPAAEIIGEAGTLYAVDVHPRAIERVKNKANRTGMRNIYPLLANAADTGLADQSIDVAFMFGLPYVVGGREKLLAELRRILKPGGVVAVKKSRVSETALIEDMKQGGMTYSGKHGRILVFRQENA
jgi:ubiquinone/menaquinone biosynthesis C-methylase UbiE